VGKSGLVEHKNGNISETRKDRGKVTMEILKELTTLFRTVAPRTPYGLLFPKIGVHNTQPKLQTLLSQERIKLYGLQIWPLHLIIVSVRTKAHKNFGERGAWEYPGTAHFWGR